MSAPTAFSTGDLRRNSRSIGRCGLPAAGGQRLAGFPDPDQGRGRGLVHRVAFAEAHHADVFISLHFNSTSDRSKETAGLETYCSTRRECLPA